MTTGVNGTSDQDVEKATEDPFGELGATGLRQSGGLIHDEFLIELQGVRGRNTYREMSLNDATIGAILRAVIMPIREVEWSFEPASDSAKDKEIAEFFDGMIHDMSITWADTIAEIMTMLTYGFSVFEKVFKVRAGPKGEQKSKFDDGKVAWRKLAPRGQDTIIRWIFDEAGGVQGYQQLASHGDGGNIKMVEIPIAKSILFTTEYNRGNPEGMSVLRTAYRPWYFKKTLETLEAIALERTGAGFPIIYLPKNATTADKNKARDLVRRVRIDEQYGITLPGPKGGSDQDGWLFELMGPPTSRGVGQGFHDAIQRYRRDIATTVLASFVLLGSEKVGSFALSRDQRDFFQIAVEGWLADVTETIQRFGIPDVMELNGWAGFEHPQLKHTDVGQIDMERLSSAISSLTTTGHLTPTRETEEFLRSTIGLPELPEEDETQTAERDDELMREVEDFMEQLRATPEVDPDMLVVAEKHVARMKSVVEREKELLWREENWIPEDDG